MENSESTTLNDAIAALIANLQKIAPPEVLSKLGEELQKLAESGIAKNAVQVGMKAPDFTLPNSDGTGAVSLQHLLKEGPVVLVFYRGGWCPFCDLQLRAYQKAQEQFLALGARLVAVSPQTADYALSDVEKKQLTFPVLYDAGNAVAKTFGLVFKLSDTMQELQHGFKNPIPKFNGDDSWTLPMPGTFVIDRDGTVVTAHVDPNYMKRLEPSAVVEALKKIQQLNLQ